MKIPRKIYRKPFQGRKLQTPVKNVVSGDKAYLQIRCGGKTAFGAGYVIYSEKGIL